MTEELFASIVADLEYRAWSAYQRGLDRLAEEYCRTLRKYRETYPDMLIGD